MLVGLLYFGPDGKISVSELILTNFQMDIHDSNRMNPNDYSDNLSLIKYGLIYLTDYQKSLHIYSYLRMYPIYFDKFTLWFWVKY